MVGLYDLIYVNDMRAASASETCTWTIVRPGGKKRLRTTGLNFSYEFFYIQQFRKRHVLFFYRLFFCGIKLLLFHCY